MNAPSDALITITCDDGYFISTDASKLDIPLIHKWLSTDCYWAIGRPLEKVRGSIEHSLSFGVYTKNKVQIGHTRVITDYCNLPSFPFSNCSYFCIYL